LYEKSRNGTVPDFTGFSSPFEIPEHPDLIIDTNNVALTENIGRISEAIFPRLRI